MVPPSGAAARAALSICESILLSLTEHRIIPEAEAKAILEDAASAHHEAARLEGGEGQAHAETADLLDRIIEHGNTVRQAAW